MATKINAIKVILKNSAGEYLVPWTEASGQNLYVPFAVNTGDTDKNGNPAWLRLEDNILTTSGEYVISSADGEVYRLSDVITYDISTLSDGTYKVMFDPEAKIIGTTQREIYVGNTFPDTAVVGDCLLNISKLPYDFEQLVSVDTDTDTDTDTPTITTTTGLTTVWVGTLIISDGEAELQLRPYNQNIILTTQQEALEQEVDDKLAEVDKKLAEVTESDIISLTSSYKSGSSWRRIYSDKWCEQGGQTGNTGYDCAYTITFPQAFADTNYSFTAMHVNTQGSGECMNVRIRTKYTSSIEVWIHRVDKCNSGTRQFQWEARGYIS